MSSSNILSFASFDCKPSFIPEEFYDVYNIDDDFVNANETELKKLFNQYKNNQIKNKKSGMEIKIITSNYDYNTAFHLKNMNKFRSVLDPAKFGYVFHYKVNSLEEVKKACQSTAGKVYGYVLRGHGEENGLVLSKNKEDRKNAEYLNAENFSKMASKDAKFTVFRSCNLAGLRMNENNMMTGMCKKIAIKTAMVVSGMEINGQSGDFTQYSQGKDGVTAKFLRKNKIYGRKFFRSKDHAYDDVDKIKDVINKYGDDYSKLIREKLANLINSSRITSTEIIDIFVIFQNKYGKSASEELISSIYGFYGILAFALNEDKDCLKKIEDKEFLKDELIEEFANYCGNYNSFPLIKSCIIAAKNYYSEVDCECFLELIFGNLFSGKNISDSHLFDNIKSVFSFIASEPESENKKISIKCFKEEFELLEKQEAGKHETEKKDKEFFIKLKKFIESNDTTNKKEILPSDVKVEESTNTNNPVDATDIEPSHVKDSPQNCMVMEELT